MYREPDHAERREASAAAKAALLARLKPKPARQAEEVIPWAEREGERIRDLIARPRKAKGPFEAAEFADDPTPVIIPAAPKVIVARAEPIRFSVCEPTPEFAPIVCEVVNMGRSKSRMKAWKVRQWKEGNRNCAYCGGRLLHQGKLIAFNNPRLATVDHREPLALGGLDHPSNYAMCCWLCNNRKGQMPEATFRTLLARGSVTLTA